jgi:thiamine-phosphate pyrophosphorylase
MTLAEVAERLNARNAPMRQGPVLPPLLLMSDPFRLPDPARAAEGLPRGSGIILREPDAEVRRRRAEALLPFARARGLILLIGNDPALAFALGAHGVHFSEARLSEALGARRRPDWLLTGAAHSLAALRQAARAGLDAALLSPVFPTASHPDARPLGPFLFAKLVRRAALPVYALGGLTSRNAALLLASGAVGLAGIEGLSARQTERSLEPPLAR